MCFDPVTLALAAAGAGATIIGSGAKRDAQNEFQLKNLEADRQQYLQNFEEAQKRNEVANRYRDTARGFATENQGTFNTGLASFMPDAQEGRMDDAWLKRAVTTSDAIGGPSGGVPLKAGAPSVIGQAYDQRIGDAFMRAHEQGFAKSRVGAYGDTQSANDRGVSDTGAKVNTVNTLARGNASLLPHEQDLVGFQVRKPIFRPAGADNPWWADPLIGLGNIAGSMAGASFKMPGSGGVGHVTKGLDGLPAIR